MLQIWVLCVSMDLTGIKEQGTLQGKRAAAEMASYGEDIKRMKFSGCTTDMIYDHIRDSKENMICEMPLDMTLGSKYEAVGQQLVEQRTPQSLDLSLRVLREKLRNEETALLLLRKLRRSQLSLTVSSGLSLIGGNHCQKNIVISNIAVTSQSNAAGHVLVRQKYTDHIPLHSSSMMSTQHVAARHQEVNHQIHARSQLPVNGTAALKESNIHPQQPRPPALIHQTQEPTLAQRQALAKLAIRRQLEAALLRLPLPKVAPEEMSFIPVIGFYADFVALVGMEEAVACITSEEATSEHVTAVEKSQPLQCALCQTDFTPQWKPEEQGAKSVICEQCAIHRRKQAFREEHTARLKAAFSQALQQEQQIELGRGLAGAVA